MTDILLMNLGSRVPVPFSVVLFPGGTGFREVASH